MENDYKNLLKNFLDEEGKLRQFPKKHKLRIAVYYHLASKFEMGRKYSEKEVNRILNKHHSFNDNCMLRRELYNRRFLNRKRDGSEYWLEENQPEMEDILK